jgi:hypothetical protein
LSAPRREQAAPLEIVPEILFEGSEAQRSDPPNIIARNAKISFQFGRSSFYRP